MQHKAGLITPPSLEEVAFMRRSLLLVSTMALALIVASGVALALPSETPDQTPMVNGTVRAIKNFRQ